MNRETLPTIRIVLVLICVALLGVVGLNVYRRVRLARHTAGTTELTAAENRMLVQESGMLSDAINRDNFGKFRVSIERLRPYWSQPRRFDNIVLDLAYRGRTRMLAYVLNHSLTPVNKAEAASFKSILLATAVQNGKADTVQMLLAQGADPNRADPWPVLDWTANRPKLGSQGLHVVQILIHAGANINEPVPAGSIASRRGLGFEGYTPLMVAARAGNTEMVKLLLASGANVAARDSLGETAATIAEKFHHPAIAQLIRHRSPIAAK